MLYLTMPVGWVIDFESQEMWAVGVFGFQIPLLYGWAPGPYFYGMLLLPVPRTHGVVSAFTHPEYPFLHRSLYHGSLQLLFSGQVS